MDFHRKCLTWGWPWCHGSDRWRGPPRGAGVPTTRRRCRRAVTSPAQVLSLDNQRRVDVNNLNMFVTNFGSWANDLSSGNSGLFYSERHGPDGDLRVRDLVRRQGER